MAQDERLATLIRMLVLSFRTKTTKQAIFCIHSDCTNYKHWQADDLFDDRKI